jgi:hypothetical protein
LLAQSYPLSDKSLVIRLVLKNTDEGVNTHPIRLALSNSTWIDTKNLGNYNKNAEYLNSVWPACSSLQDPDTVSMWLENQCDLMSLFLANGYTFSTWPNAIQTVFNSRLLSNDVLIECLAKLVVTVTQKTNGVYQAERSIELIKQWQSQFLPSQLDAMLEQPASIADLKLPNQWSLLTLGLTSRHWFNATLSWFEVSERSEVWLLNVLLELLILKAFKFDGDKSYATESDGDVARLVAVIKDYPGEELNIRMLEIASKLQDTNLNKALSILGLVLPSPIAAA